MDTETLPNPPKATLDGIDSSEVMKEIDRFLDNRKHEFESDQRDFKVSKNIASGNGFSMSRNKNKNLSQQRTRVCMSGMIIEPVINSIVSKFTSDPFQFETQAPIDNEELIFQLASALREAATDGKAYILTYVGEDSAIKFSKLNNFNVVYGHCGYVDGADVKRVAYIDKKQVDIGSRRKSSLAISLQPVLELQPDEIPVMTYWKLEGGLLKTYTIENDKITKYDEAPAKYLPVTRIYAKETYIGLDSSYRGLYYIVKDVLKTIDYTASRIQERIAAAPNAYFTISNQALGNNLDQWNNINDKPKAFLTWNESYGNGNVNTAPEKNDLSVYVSELLESLSAHKQIIDGTLGITSESLSGIPETAEAILFRKENKDSAANELLKNLLDSAWQIAAVIQDISGLECKIAASIFDKLKKQDEMQKIIALVQLVSSNNNAFAALPSIIERMDLDPQSMKNLMHQFAVSRQPTQNEIQLQQQLQAERQQAMAMKDQLMTLNATLESGLYKEQFAHNLKIYEANMKGQIELKKLMIEEMKLRIASGQNAEENQLRLLELEKEISASERKAQLEAVKIAENARQADMKSVNDINRVVGFGYGTGI